MKKILDSSRNSRPIDISYFVESELRFRYSSDKIEDQIAKMREYLGNLTQALVETNTISAEKVLELVGKSYSCFKVVDVDE